MLILTVFSDVSRRVRLALVWPALMRSVRVSSCAGAVAR
jgi:hypothetical protein